MNKREIKPIPAHLAEPLREAMAHHRAKRWREAEAIYRKAADQEPDHPVILGSWGTVLLEMKNADAAVEVFEHALSIDPDYILVLVTLAKAWNKLGNFEQSYDCCRRALALDPNVIDTHVVLGDTLRLLDQIDEARAAYQTALDLDPDNASAAMGVAYCRFTLGEHDDAIRVLRETIDKHPDSMIGQWSLSQFLLLLGQFEEGWERFKWRWEFGDTPPPEMYVGRPVWDGTSLEGKTVLVWNEQGLGDEMLFSTCLADLLSKARPSKTYLASDRRLIPIFERTFPGIEFLPMEKSSGQGWQVTLPEFDIQVAAGDLPKYYRLSAADFPDQPVRFLPDPEKVSRWQTRFDALGPGPKVGIAWRGGIKGIFGRKKSTSLKNLAPILGVEGLQFVNIQYGECRDELAEVAESLGIRVHDWDDLDPVADPDEQMAQISCLDLVVQTSNASAHMAGILNVPVWSMIPYFPDWRWSLTGEKCLWYPSMRVFRQPSPGDWDSVFSKVSSELRQWAAAARADQ